MVNLTYFFFNFRALTPPAIVHQNEPVCDIYFSSLSAVLNACALVAVEDIMHGWLRIKLKPLTEGIIARLVTALLATISIVMLIVIEKLGGVLGKKY